MEVKKRTFNNLKKEKTFEDLNRFAKEVTEAYATSPLEYSQTNTSMDNNLTKNGLRDLMDYAIITALVSLDIATLVLNKAIKNQQRKVSESGSGSIYHHKKLIKARVEYVAGGYTKAEINKIAIDMSDNPFESITYFTGKYNIESDKVTRKLLERAIVENIVSDEVMEKIIQRSLKDNKNEQAKQYFTYIRSQREKNSQ